MGEILILTSSKFVQQKAAGNFWQETVRGIKKARRFDKERIFLHQHTTQEWDFSGSAASAVTIKK